MWHVHAVLTRLPIDAVTIDDEVSYRHIGVYSALKAVLKRDRVVFAVPAAPLAHEDNTALLNLAFWKPGDVSEILVDDHMSGDQLVHNAWHHLAWSHLGEAAKSAAGLLLAEAIASASDVYLIGRMLGHAPDSDFLATQVPAMADAAQAAGLDAEGFEELLSQMSDAPEASFEAMRALLFDVSRALASAADADAAAEVLAAHAEHPFAPLLHHYELSSWVLFTRAYAAAASEDAALAVDRALRDAEDAMGWLEQHWLNEPPSAGAAGRYPGAAAR